MTCLASIPEQRLGPALFHSLTWPVLAASRGPAYSQHSVATKRMQITSPSEAGRKFPPQRGRYLLLGTEHVPGTAPNAFHTLFPVIRSEPCEMGPAIIPSLPQVVQLGGKLVFKAQLLAPIVTALSTWL